MTFVLTERIRGTDGLMTLGPTTAAVRTGGGTKNTRENCRNLDCSLPPCSESPCSHRYASKMNRAGAQSLLMRERAVPRSVIMTVDTVLEVESARTTSIG